MKDVAGPWRLTVRSDGTLVLCEWTYSKLGRADGSFLENKLRDDDKSVKEGLTIVYKSDLFLKEAGGVITQASNVGTVRLGFTPFYYLKRNAEVPPIRFFKEFISKVVLSQHLRTLVLDVPFLAAADEENAVAAFSRCRLKRLCLESHLSIMFWVRMVDVSRCHATRLDISSGLRLDCPQFLTAINQNMRGDFTMWTVADCLAKRVKYAHYDEKAMPLLVEKDWEVYQPVTLASRAFFSFMGMTTAQMERPLACAAERMRIQTINYGYYERTLILRDCALAGGHLPDMTVFGDGLRRLRVIACGLIE